MVRPLMASDVVAAETESESMMTNLNPVNSDEKLVQTKLDSSVLPAQSFPVEQEMQLQLQLQSQSKTFFYLAYGSNLSKAIFQGVRGIQPLSAINVVVPELRLTFDLPGKAYTEPCFANTARRRTRKSIVLEKGGEDEEEIEEVDDEDSRGDDEDDEDVEIEEIKASKGWRKGLVGVVYEVTHEDFAHIIATEGGGLAYQDILVKCYRIPEDSNSVPEDPTTEEGSFLAHTLFAPSQDSSRYSRPRPDYAQPSHRYMNLLKSGSKEHNLPQEYQDYLHEIHCYQISTRNQAVGKFLFESTWGFVINRFIKLRPLFGDKNGRSPPWLTRLAAVLIRSAWANYDSFFKPTFGDGERTIEDPYGGDAIGRDKSVTLDEKKKLLDLSV